MLEHAHFDRAGRQGRRIEHGYLEPAAHLQALADGDADRQSGGEHGRLGQTVLELLVAPARVHRHTEQRVTLDVAPGREATDLGVQPEIEGPHPERVRQLDLGAGDGASGLSQGR